MVVFASNHRAPDGSWTLVLDEDDFTRTEKVIFAAGFGYAWPAGSLLSERPDRPYPRLFSARTGEELVRQVRSLPTDGSPAAELRERLCATLDVSANGPAEGRLTSLDVLTPAQVLAEVERIRLCVAVLATPEGSDERRWLVIDDTILDGHTVRAVKAFRDEFGGGLKEAMEAVHARTDVLRRLRPQGYAVRV